MEAVNVELDKTRAWLLLFADKSKVKKSCRFTTNIKQREMQKKAVIRALWVSRIHL